MVVGYLRVSAGGQRPASQQEEIRRFAENRNLAVDRWVAETVSGKTKGNARKLERLLQRMKPGDTLIVTEISRLSRTLAGIMAIMGKCLARKVNLYSTREGYSFDDSVNGQTLCFAFGLIAEIERNLLSRRTKEALALRKAEGAVLGRRKGSCPKTDILAANRETVIRMLGDDRSVTDICRHFGLSRDTFAKFRTANPAVRKALKEKEERRTARFGKRD